MPRKYTPKGLVRYKQYTKQTIEKAVEEARSGSSVLDVSERFKVPIRTLRDRLNGIHPKPHGGQTIFTKEEEDIMSVNLILCADFGMPLCTTDVKLFVKGYLNKIDRTVRRFSNNTPGDDWVRCFLKRHKELSKRMCQNINRKRAELKASDVRQYFDNLKKSSESVPPENILNYDETNLSDDPGTKKCIFKRGVKYPERVINHSKGNISILFSGTASGELLPPYVVYKCVHLYDSWVFGGPTKTRFGRSKNGWMDMDNFETWFESTVLPWARRQKGKKVLIGDNLSSHISFKVLQGCAAHNIAFVMLLPNSTDKCQPLDVAFFGPMKKAWRAILEEHRTKYPSSQGLNKAQFPSLLKRLMDGMGLRNEENLKAGFKACGIVPLDPNVVLNKLPSKSFHEEDNDNDETIASPPPKRFISPALLEYLQQFRYDPDRQRESSLPKKKRLSLEPGKSISEEDARVMMESKSSKVAKKKIPKKAKLSGRKDTVTTSSSTTVLQEDSVATACDDKNIGDFVIVRLVGKQKAKYYVAEILTSDVDGLFDVKFLRQSPKAPNKFLYPVVIDASEISKDDIVMSLPKPGESSMQTKRQASILSFGELDLSYCE